MLWKWQLLLLIATAGYTVAVPKNCCSGDNVILKKLCSDGKSIDLSCSKRYLLDEDLDDEKYEIDIFGNLNYRTPLQMDTITIERDKYCLAKMDSVEGSQVAIICFDAVDHEQVEHTWYGLRAICGFVSVFFILATLTVYCLVPSLRDLQGKCIMHSLAALAVSLFNLGLLQIFAMDEMTCKFYSFFNYFTFMTTFFWLNVTSFHVWKTVVRPQKMEDQKIYKFYLGYGYGMPSLFLIILLITHHVPGEHLSPKMGVNTCWFGGLRETFAYFYGPISVLLLVNLIMFVWSTSVLLAENNKLNEPKLKSLKYKLSLYSKLFLIMGLTWMFEVISAATDNVHKILNYIWVVTDYINVLQGVLIFVLLVVLRKRALRGLSDRGFFCLKFPTTWKTLEDQETEGAEAETRLSQNEYA